MNMQVEQVEHGVGVVSTSLSGEGPDDRWLAEAHTEEAAREWHDNLGQAAAMIDNAVSELEARAEQVPDAQRDRVLFELEAAYRHLEYAIGTLPPVEVVATDGPPY